MSQPKSRRLVTETAQDKYRDEVLPDYFRPLTRGNLEEADLNDLRFLTEVGEYTVRSQNILNGPVLPVSGRLTHIRLTRPVSNGVLQEVINQDGMWYRTLAHESGPEWYPWKKVSELEPIISNDPNEYIENGETLWVYDERVASTEFDSGLTGWTRLMGEGVWDMIDVPEFRRGRGAVFLRNTGFGGDSMVSWNLYGDDFLDGDVTMQAVIRAETATRSHCIAVRASHNGSTFSGYIAGVNWESGQAYLFVARIIDGVYARLSRTAIDSVTAGVPYWIRLRIEGNWLRARVWTTDEPKDWQVAAAVYPVSSALPAGRVGVLHSGTGGRYVGAFAVDTSGGTA